MADVSSKSEDKVPLIGYLSAATIAASIPFVVTQILMLFSETDPIIYFFSLFLSALIGGAISGYLMKRRFGNPNIYSTTLNGFLAYILLSLFNSITGFYIEINDFFFLIALIFGGIGGFRFFDMLENRRITTSN
jgi:hypothetical protein